MNSVMPFIVAGIAGGAVYALIAIGLVLVNNSSRLLNFAQGEIGGVAAFVVVQLSAQAGLPIGLAVVVGLVVGAACGLGAWAALLRVETGGKLPPLVGTIAIISLLTIVESRYLGGPQVFRPPLTGTGPRIFGAYVSPTRLLVIATVAAACAGLWFLLNRTSVGLELRAGADNRAAASMIGLRPQRIEAVAWTVAGVLAGIGGVLLGWINGSVSPGFATLALPRAFAAAIVGGMTSLPGAVVGGVIVGVSESLTRKWFGSIPGSTEVVVFGLIFLTLLFRPQGLFGRRVKAVASEASESLVSLHALVRIPMTTAARTVARARSWLTAAITACFVLAIVRLLPATAAYKVSLIPIYVILALSLNSLLATTGQLSLCHVGLLGLGAFMTGVSATTWHLPFLLALAVGVVSTGVVALLLGLSALRVRGLYLAVMTLAFAVVLENYVFPRPFFAHGGAGLPVRRPRFGSVRLTDERSFLVVALLALALFLVIDRKVLASPAGRALIGLRENQVGAMARGIRPAVLPVLAFAFSGMAAGLAGGLFAYRQGLVAATSFPALASLTFVLYVVLGGIGSPSGVAAATAVFVLVTAFKIPFLRGDLVTSLGALGLILTIGAHPEGIGGQVRDAIARRRRRPTAEPQSAPTPTSTSATAAVAATAPARSRPARTAKDVALIEADKLTVRFAGLTALDGVSIRVEPEQIVAVIGPNGAGKTTLFNCLSGFVTPVSGTMRLMGRSVDRTPPATRAGAGLGRTFQQGGLWLSETVLGNLLIAQHRSLSADDPVSMLALGHRELLHERRRVAMAEQVLAILRLSDLAHEPVRSLPYGVRKTLELGCALVGRPRVLLLDEPAAGATQKEAAELAHVIAAIRRELGIGVLVIEHHVPLVKDVADTISVLNFGSVLTSGPPDRVTNDPAVMEAYLGSRATALTTAAGPA